MQPALAPRTAGSPPTMSQDQVKAEQMLPQQQYPPPPQSSTLPESMDAIPQQQQQQPQHQPQASSPNASINNDGVTGSAESDGADTNTDGRKGYGKRELSTSKRAAQNRAAQRAFRQRKEGYIKKLEEQVRDYQALSENFKAVQAENYQLRDYIINLQSRLLESQGEVPPPPSTVDGLQPGKPSIVQNPSLRGLTELAAVPPSQDGVSQDPPRTSAYPDPTYSEAPAAKRPRTESSEMTDSQAALQGSTILSQSSATAQ
ncbi:hypothetical protein HRR83_001359 [Exophiala dermatitidis]|uniref:Putative transcription factor kapC n=2 Tax=Exophiala dermatitidis TaxID=5970 RepID=H6C6M1_EXODN|nr:uncharacterized protein HMPREF1120_07358 [Exophiala dermatitidis NIH/UT8656]KAJ4526170.1 hypothetical protein HRR74_001363 [Exophiala dermatitidis]EHY59367.1 hypothetical protein HMPREF1120_07358 [Exophiala dermatitidis NIH/UT8656]KAJ4526886.1 hypothetical protein HRR73_001683 [Exophiala dermatitidis]KAJ4532597.1 hypothetical protein HRR76_007585 [Exophiala dermatitidis]KAJ4546891.1 hypothetical protein HRR77_004431 [Exophiala dermatitidis]